LGSGYLEIAIASILASSVGPLVKVITLPVTVIALGRFVFAWLTLMVSRRLRTTPLPAGEKEHRRTLIAAGCCTAATLMCFMGSFRFIPVATAVLLAFCYPVFATFMAHLFLGEHIGGSAVAALVVSAAGATLIALPEVGGAGGGNGLGITLALASGAFAALEVTLIKKIGAFVSSRTVNLYRYGTAGVLAAPLALLSQWRLTVRDAALVVTMGVLHTALLGVLYVAGLKKAEAHKAAILSYLEPLSATVLAWVLLAEKPTLLTILGGSLVLGGSYLVIGSALRQRARVARANR
jgi:drug/metabolite transporter (DMT)-like permease